MFKGLWKEFREFAMRGSVLDLAIGIIIGAAFGRIVTSLVNDVIMPPIGLAVGNVDFRNLFVTLSGGDFKSLDEAKAAGAATLNYGLFVNNVIDFLVVALVLFLLIRQINRLARRPAPPPALTTRECPFCASSISIKATRCPQCTSQLATS